MDIEPNKPGTLEDLMLSSSVMIWILYFPFGIYTTPELPWILPLDLWTLDLDPDLNWINRFSTPFSAFALDRFRLWIIVVLSLRLLRRFICTCFWIYGPFGTHPGQLQ